jgi:uncharacterized protein
MRRRTFLLGISTFFAAGAGYALGHFDVIERSWAKVSPYHVAITVPMAGYGPQKVVYHVTEKGSSWFDRDAEAHRLISVVSNHIRAVEPEDVEIEVIFHGNGVDLLRRAKANPEIGATFDNLRRQKVNFRVCANTLNSSNIPLSALHGVRETDLVQSAVAEIVKLEREGYSYVRF